MIWSTWLEDAGWSDSSLASWRTTFVVRNGDRIDPDVAAGKLHLDVPADELERRAKAWNGFTSPYDRGYTKIFVDHVLQADTGADLDFLVGKSGTPEMRESH